VLKWTAECLTLSKNDFIVSRLARRDALSEFLSAIAGKRKIRGASVLTDGLLNEVSLTIEELKRKSN
jgi:hypothetical protein